MRSRTRRFDRAASGRLRPSLTSSARDGGTPLRRRARYPSLVNAPSRTALGVDSLRCNAGTRRGRTQHDVQARRTVRPIPGMASPADERSTHAWCPSPRARPTTPRPVQLRVVLVAAGSGDFLDRDQHLFGPIETGVISIGYAAVRAPDERPDVVPSSAVARRWVGVELVAAHRPGRRLAGEVRA